MVCWIDHATCLIYSQMTLIEPISQKAYLRNIARPIPYINSIVYTEIAIGFDKIEQVDEATTALGIKVLEIPREVLFLTGKVFLQYRRNKGTKKSSLPDFFIEAHAAVSQLHLITRDSAKYNTYYPQLKLIDPKSEDH